MSPPQPLAPAKRTFLKRGEGVARFGVGGKPPAPAKRKGAALAKKSGDPVKSTRAAPKRSDTKQVGIGVGRP